MVCILHIHTITMNQDNIAFRIGPISPAVSGPLYQQIVTGFKREIGEGRLSGNTPLPSFRLLAEQLLVSVITVKRAYEELEREGIIYRRQGLGTFVAEDGRKRSRDSKLENAETLIQDAIKHARESGMNPKEVKLFIDQIVTKTLRKKTP